MGNNRFHWGLIGPGRIANAFARGLEVIEDASLYAVASAHPERAVAFARQYGAEKVYDSYAALVADPGVDAVYIATPHRFHYENIRLCLEAGKPVLCEKPLTVNAPEARQLIELARSRKVFLMEALWSVYLPVYAQVRQWLDAGQIGDVLFMVSSLGGDVNRDPSDRWLNPELAGGALLDMGVYPISISQWVMRKNPVSFSAKAILGETGVDVVTAGILQYEHGEISQFTCNFFDGSLNRFCIYGARGHICIENPWGATQASLVADGQETVVALPHRASGFEYETEEAMRCIRAGMLESPVMTQANSLANAELMDGIRRSIGVKFPFES